jgi:hypothetical protein
MMPDTKRGHTPHVTEDRRPHFVRKLIDKLVRDDQGKPVLTGFRQQLIKPGRFVHESLELIDHQHVWNTPFIGNSRLSKPHVVRKLSGNSKTCMHRGVQYAHVNKEKKGMHAG